MRIPKINNDRMRRHRARGVPDRVVFRVDCDSVLSADDHEQRVQFPVSQWRRAMSIKHKRSRVPMHMEIMSEDEIDYRRVKITMEARPRFVEDRR